MDKGCEVPHDHDSVVIVTVPLLNDEFVDFKTVKLATETLLEKMMNKNITDLFALGTTEELVERGFAPKNVRDLEAAGVLKKIIPPVCEVGLIFL